MYKVDYDMSANILNIHVAGFMAPEDVPPFAAEVDFKARQARVVRGDFNVIVESFDFPVQATDVAELLAGIVGTGMVLTTGRSAVVVGSHLNKLQAERTLIHPRLKVFSTMEDAQDWLGSAAE